MVGVNVDEQSVVNKERWEVEEQIPAAGEIVTTDVSVQLLAKVLDD